MGHLREGVWRNDRIDPKHAGHYVRSDSVFRAEGIDGATDGGSDRFHLYISYACPWAHRALIARALLGLESRIPISSVHWFLGDDGWTFEAPFSDPLGGRAFLRDVYLQSDPNYTGRVTVPVLWDRRENAIVCNESSDIIRLLNDAFRPWATRELDLYPEPLRPEIDAINARVYATLNDGVYKCGFARNQAAYEAAVVPLFDTLDWLEQRLATRRWLMGDAVTEADVRLFPTAIRFDPIYHFHFKCSLRRLIDYPNLWRWTRAFLALPGIDKTVDLPHARKHYFQSHESINPSRVVPLSPALDYTPEYT